MTALVIGTNSHGHSIWFGTDGERTAELKAALDWFLVKGGSMYESDGTAWNPKRIGGSEFVVPGIGSVESFTRYYDLSTTYAAGTHYEEFSEADNIREVIIQTHSTTAEADQANDFTKFLFDAPDGLTAGLMLALAGGVGVNVGWETVTYRTPAQRVLTGPLRSIALLPVNEAQKLAVTFIKGGA